MDFDAAITAHSNWKVRLRSYINGNNQSQEFDLHVVGADNLCALGKWIYEDGAKYSNLEDYQKLKELHARFHQLTANILRSSQHGSKNFAPIEPGSEYSDLSLKVITYIRRLRKISEGR